MGAGSSFIRYIKHVFSGLRSIVSSCLTATPYLFNVNSGELRKEVTEQYPDPISSRTADDLPTRTRGLLFNDIEKCTGCKECLSACPSKCITIENDSQLDTSKAWVAVFDIDFSRCIFCGLCVEACQPSSLVHTRQYEGAVYSLPDLVASFGKGQVTDEQRAKWEQIRQARETEGYL